MRRFECGERRRRHIADIRASFAVGGGIKVSIGKLAGQGYVRGIAIRRNIQNARGAVRLRELKGARQRRHILDIDHVARDETLDRAGGKIFCRIGKRRTTTREAYERIVAAAAGQRLTGSSRRKRIGVGRADNTLKAAEIISVCRRRIDGSHDNNQRNNRRA